MHGQEYKPDDYLKLFKDFLLREGHTIEALQILLNRPEELRTEILDDLREKLSRRPEQFTTENLHRAYGNNLGDIIGMIKSAIADQPLLNTKQRVARAIKAVTEGKILSEPEKQWLDLIANHLEYNLIIEKKHFASIPFSGRGGWKRANQDFNNNLENILEKLNKVMAS